LKNISVNIIVNRDRGCHNLLRGTISWLFSLKENYLPKGTINEVIVTCSDTEQARTKVMLKPLEKEGITTKVIPKKSIDVDKAESRNNMMKQSTNNLILFLDPTQLIGSTARGYIQRVLQGKIMKSIETILVTEPMRIGAITLSEEQSLLTSIYLFPASKIITYNEPKEYQIINRQPFLFYNDYPNIIWIDYIPPMFYRATYPKKLTEETRKRLNFHRQALVLRDDSKEIIPHVASLSLDFSRMSSIQTYPEDYAYPYNFPHTKVEPYFVTYKKRGIYKDAFATMRFPNPYEIRPIIKVFFYGSNSFIHYSNQKLRYYLPDQYAKLKEEIRNKPRLYQYAQDKGVYVFPVRGPKSLFYQMEPVYDLINPKE